MTPRSFSTKLTCILLSHILISWSQCAFPLRIVSYQQCGICHCQIQYFLEINSCCGWKYPGVWYRWMVYQPHSLCGICVMQANTGWVHTSVWTICVMQAYTGWVHTAVWTIFVESVWCRLTQVGCILLSELSVWNPCDAGLHKLGAYCCLNYLCGIRVMQAYTGWVHTAVWTICVESVWCRLTQVGCIQRYFVTGLPTCIAGENGVIKCLFGTTQTQVHHRVDILTRPMQCISVAHSTSIETKRVDEFAYTRQKLTPI